MQALLSHTCTHSHTQDVVASSVFMSGPHHAMFSLALADVYHADFGYDVDFSKVEGIPVSWGLSLSKVRCHAHDQVEAVEVWRHPMLSLHKSELSLHPAVSVTCKPSLSCHKHTRTHILHTYTHLQGLFIANQMRSKSGKPDDFDLADLLGFPLVSFL